MTPPKQFRIHWTNLLTKEEGRSHAPLNQMSALEIVKDANREYGDMIAFRIEPDVATEAKKDDGK